MFCSFCNKEAFLPGVIDPPMCIEHHDIMKLVQALLRSGKALTVENVNDLLVRIQEDKDEPLNITPEQVPDLLSNVIGSVAG